MFRKRKKHSLKSRMKRSLRSSGSMGRTLRNTTGKAPGGFKYRKHFKW